MSKRIEMIVADILTIETRNSVEVTLCLGVGSDPTS
jgi:hypothetical protein